MGLCLERVGDESLYLHYNFETQTSSWLLPPEENGSKLLKKKNFRKPEKSEITLLFVRIVYHRIKEDGLYRYREVKLPSLVPRVSEAELELELQRETGQRRRGRDIFLAVDQGPNSKYAFDWALIHLCRMADTLHLVNAVSSIKNEGVHDANQGLMDKLAVEAYQAAMVKYVARIVEGDAGKVICQEAERIKPAAVVVGTRGRSLMQSVPKGSVSEYCFQHCKKRLLLLSFLGERLEMCH